MLNVNKSRTTPFQELIMFLAIYFIFVFSGPYLSIPGVDNNIITFLTAVVFAGIIFFNLKTTHLFEKNILHRRSSKMLIITLSIISFLWLFLALGMMNNITSILKLSPQLIILAMFSALSAGIFEEFLVRGLAVHFSMKFLEKSRYSIFLSVIFSSIIFGLLHISNSLVMSQSFTSTAQQVFYATAIGIFLAVLRIMTNGLILPVLIHSLIDFSPTVTSGTPIAVQSWTPILSVFIPIIILMSIAAAILNSEKNHFSN
ncbi:CPBP family intramembrane metalloprotease [Weissella diestrammenae]|uniref:CPBP family intramembrane metalloprotease n=1 Tax=Weissella diestrammenae TaxID=1162633 RepID=A0A7G9T3V5_9LACO|nr:CPBP family intramembrane glutamic endopeptidase [Weissella diestrammenae]MCM0582769.1 CPBP family intramembrane metalloprotease [Weissella diestrammenae]QNN74780.1 CPBP family intramembrane metalloprotease [Weissella diestrammenae]